MRRHFCAPFCASLVSIVAFVSSARATDTFYFTSTPGSWIGQGQTKTLSPVTAHRTGSLGAYTNSLSFSAGGYELELVGGGNTLLGVGYYANAVRYPFNDGSPGMWMSAPGRGDNQISGWFNVLQAAYNTDGSVKAFSVDFRQYDESSTINYTEGSVRYNVPEPTAAFAFGVLTTSVRRRRSRS